MTMVEVESAKPGVANFAAISSLISKLRQAYGDATAGVVEWALRSAACSWLGGGNGDRWSMLTAVRHELQHALNFSKQQLDDLHYCLDYESTDRLTLHDLLKEFEARILELWAKLDQAEWIARVDLIEAIDAAFEGATDWKFGRENIALSAISQKFRIACDCPYQLIEERLNSLGLSAPDLADCVRSGSMSLIAARAILEEREIGELP
jgi:hypothetical protein